MEDARSQRILKSIARCLVNDTELKSVVDIHEESVEDTEPQNAILNWLRENAEGKLLTVKIEGKLREIHPDVRIVRRFGMCNLQWNDKDNGLLMAYSEKAVRIDTNFIKENNRAHFEALEERNEKRRKALENKKELVKFQSLLDNFILYSNKVKKY